MRLRRLLVLSIIIMLTVLGIRAFSTQAFTPVTTIAVPPGGVSSMDIVWADASLGRVYMADRTNSGIDSFLMSSLTFNGRIPAGGVGTAGAPNGVATDAGNNLVFAGLGASGVGGAFLVANATTYGVISQLPMTKPGGGAATGRSDELAVDPTDRLVVVANDQDSPPFVTELSYTPGGIPTIVSQIPLPTQTGCGIEQTVWVPETHQFMTALPTTGGCPGGIAVFNTSPFALARTIPTDCSPQGMAHGPDSLMFLGCSTGAPEVINFLTGAKIATLGALPSSDEVWYDRAVNAYEFLIGAPTNTLNIYNAATNALVETDPLGGAFHNLAADAGSGRVFVGLRPANTVCPVGCVSVFGPPSNTSSVASCTGVPGGALTPGGTVQCIVTIASAVTSGLSLAVNTPLGAVQQPPTLASCGSATASAAGAAVTVSGAVPAGCTITETFTVPPTATGCITQTATGLAGSSAFSITISATGPGACVGAGANAPLDPTDEFKTCTNTASNTALNQVLGGTSQSLGVAGPSKTFTLPLFAGASTCALQVYRNGIPCNTTTNPCADGNIQLTLSTGSGAAISCATTGNLPAGQVLPAVSQGGGSCQQQVQNTQVNAPCGVTAGTAAASTTPSNTCTGILFDLQSLLGACVNSPTSGFCSNFNGTNFAGTTATITVIFFATPANGGSVGGIQLGTNTFTFSAPAIGLLLVTASPQLIPSNGTVASVVTATFACGSGATSLNGFPLSAAGVTVPATFTTGSTTIVNQPIVGTGQNAVCGAGLAGTFNFTSPGPVLFDNGRSSESVNCGAGGNVSPFGVGAAPFGTPFGFAGNGVNSTFPLIFTCTGAAVLAIGAGVAGDAPINVVYQGPLGLSAVGSTLITVSPSGIPRIAVSCNPSTIAAGSTGSICTATVTDINGTPLSGMTGATVTWTVSDPSNASILPCLVNVPGNLNITTYPNIAPQISPNTPCQVPTSQIPGQNTTFLNGQAAALLVASPTAHPETVTVVASLGVLIPPSFACLVSPYTPTGFGTITSPFTATSGVGLPGTTGCGFGNPVGFTGLASALSPTANGLGIGGVILPNTTSASTTVNIGGPAGILIAGATATQPYALLRGCNQIIATTTAGTPIANIAALVSPASAVVSIWRFSNNTKQFQAGFFSDPNAPTDFNVTGGINAAPSNTTTGTQAGPGIAGNQVTETYFICVNQAATIVSG